MKLRELVSTFYQEPLGPQDGTSALQLELIERWLGTSLPRVLREFYLLVGDRLPRHRELYESVLEIKKPSDHHLLAPKDLAPTEERFLIVAWEHQGFWSCGVQCGESEEDPAVVCRLKSEKSGQEVCRLSEFLSGFLIAETVRGAAEGRAVLGELRNPLFKTTTAGEVEERAESGRLKISLPEPHAWTISSGEGWIASNGARICTELAQEALRRAGFEPHRLEGEAKSELGPFPEGLTSAGGGPSGLSITQLDPDALDHGAASLFSSFGPSDSPDVNMLELRALVAALRLAAQAGPLSPAPAGLTAAIERFLVDPSQASADGALAGASLYEDDVEDALLAQARRPRLAAHEDTWLASCCVQAAQTCSRLVAFHRRLPLLLESNAPSVVVNAERRMAGGRSTRVSVLDEIVTHLGGTQVMDALERELGPWLRGERDPLSR